MSIRLLMRWSSAWWRLRGSGRRRAVGSQRRSGSRQRRIHQLLELVVRQWLRDHAATDDEGGCAASLALKRDLLVRLHLRLRPLAIDALLELLLIHADLRAEALEEALGAARCLTIPLILGLVQQIMHRPEFALLIRARGSSGCLPGVAMHPERVIDGAHPHDPRLDEPSADVRLRDRREARA